MEFEFENTKLRFCENGTMERWIVKGWKIVKSKQNCGYLRIRINEKEYLQHRIIGMVFLGLDINDTKLQIDHINRIKTDNRIENLRIVNNQQNQWNQNSKGYRYHKNKWEAYIIIDGKQISKRFDTEEEAKDWYLEQKAIHHII